MKDIAIIYLAGGFSSRFGGKIKQFAEVGPDGETLIEYSMNQALKAGFNKIIFIVSVKTEKAFKEKFGNKYKKIPIKYALQEFNPESRDKPWGTCDALCSAKNLIDCPFVVCNGDDIYGEDAFKTLFNHLKNKNTNATLGYKLGEVLSETGEVNRGIFQVEKGKVKKIKEFLGVSRKNLNKNRISENSPTSMTMWAFQPEILKLLNEKLISFKEKNEGDRKIECLLPNELNELIKEKKIEIEIHPTNEKWFGVTNPEDEIKVREELKKI